MRAMVSSGARIRRGFIDIAEGQVHYREAGRRMAGTPPLLLIHASPGSSLMLEPLLREFGKFRHVIATDTLGNGDSSAPAGDAVTLAALADAHLRALDTLGIGRFDLYGTHTGASIASEIAISQPGRVRSLVLDGIGLYAPEEQAELLEHYVPGISIDQNGSQLLQIWSFVRDAYLFWPWYRKDKAHRRPTGLPDADTLHDKVVEVLKAARSFHLSYRAALGHDKRARLPLVPVPTLLTCAADDMLYEYLDAVHALMPHARCAAHHGTGTPENLARTVALFERHFSEKP
ncbi:alpha/beta fold hydrolase [Parapusillimonas granuli]|uniref:Alpha/beta hydrolase n=1 Tax=Parapusillimonas granuli TaxID=380911 RepID=A0A853G103_9BURK|nr:alpha/beta hydrolase [Parapusillimonas granuli]MBB5213663.1 pimeloyl-ACP methyl ester carboxylesterase [Parapusillimonas granuli]NYT48501.1 alpha/beta hydrolase [Parapusillimonas granuli]